MPYSRFKQAVRIAAETQADMERTEWTRSAFVGWQVASVFAGSNVGPFKKYLKGMGLAPPEEKLTKEEVQREKTRALANAERVRRAFDGG